jgi:hypothetical protein
VGGEVAQTMYTHVSKCKSAKIKEEKIRKETSELNDTMDQMSFRHLQNISPNSGRIHIFFLELSPK